MRPGLVVCVVGTGTEIGKTWVAARTLRHLLHAGVPVAARKPVQSYDPGDAMATDAELLAGATGEAAPTVCPPHRWYPLALAPPMAAAELGRPPFTVTELAGEIGWPDSAAVGLVETAGGVRSPIAADGDTIDLCAAIRPDRIVLVADASLGAINAVLLSVGALQPVGAPIVVVLNRFDRDSRVHTLNLEWLTSRLDCPVVTDCEGLAELLAPRAQDGPAIAERRR